MASSVALFWQLISYQIQFNFSWSTNWWNISPSMKWLLKSLKIYTVYYLNWVPGSESRHKICIFVRRFIQRKINVFYMQCCVSVWWTLNLVQKYIHSFLKLNSSVVFLLCTLAILTNVIKKVFSLSPRAALTKLLVNDLQQWATYFPTETQTCCTTKRPNLIFATTGGVNLKALSCHTRRVISTSSWSTNVVNQKEAESQQRLSC